MVVFVAMCRMFAGQDGGERGIRTPGELPHTRFPVVHLQPLGHLSNSSRLPVFPLAALPHAGWAEPVCQSVLLAGKVAERQGFEPWVREHVHEISNLAP